MMVYFSWFRFLAWILSCGVLLCTVVYSEEYNGDGLVFETEDAIIVEAARIPRKTLPTPDDAKRVSRKSKVVDDEVTPEDEKVDRVIRQKRQLGGWPGVLPIGPCFTSKGVFGHCTSFRKCYPYFKLPELSNWETWILGMYDTCSYFTASGRQMFGVCCTNPGNPPQHNPVATHPPAIAAPEDPPTSASPPLGQQPNPSNPAIPVGWPPTIPPIPTHPPDHTAPTHPPLPGHPVVQPDPTQAPPPTTAATQSPIHPPPPTAPPIQWPPPFITHPPASPPPSGPTRPPVQWPPPAPTHPPVPTHPPQPTPAPPAKPPQWPPQYPTHPPPQWPPQAPTHPPPAAAPPTAAPADPGIIPVGDASCGAKNGYQDQERIVGGGNADLGEWPWIAALFNGGRQFCGGSLIDPTHILTAAHCVAHMSSWDVARLTVRLGDHNIKTNSETTHVEKKVQRVVRHRGFDSRTLYNDVAILTLDSPVTYTQQVRPICLPAGSSSLYNGITATVIGWGSLREGGQQPGILQEVSIPIWTNQECKAKYGNAAPGGIVEHFLCAGQASRDSCSGDSGGPLMINQGRWMQVGIVSWGIGCGKGQYPGVYTRVTYFMPWITKNLK